LETYIIFSKVENWRSEVSPPLSDESKTLYLLNNSVMSFFIGDIIFSKDYFLGGGGSNDVDISWPFGEL
jgi:hypothetical protein